jgi:hypothetical protein
MKRFISALTAVCLAASMTVTSLPASALSIADRSASDVAQAGDRTWYMEDYVVEDLDAFAAKPTVAFPIYYSGDTGTFGYSVTVLADGQKLKERFSKVAAKQQGTTKMSGFVANYDESLFGGSESE